MFSSIVVSVTLDAIHAKSPLKQLKKEHVFNSVRVETILPT